MDKTLKELRAKTGLTQSEFGKRLGGIPLRTIQNWESGERTPPAWTLELIVYRVENDENFLTEEEKEHRRENLDNMKAIMAAYKEYKAIMKKQ